jgi:hypothetical protein
MTHQAPRPYLFLPLLYTHMARSLHPALKARVAMLKAYAKTHNCSYKEAMIATKGKKGARRTKKHGGDGEDADPEQTGGADEPAEVGGAVTSGEETAQSTPALVGGRRRRKSARRTCRRSRKRSHRRRR